MSDALSLNDNWLVVKDEARENCEAVLNLTDADRWGPLEKREYDGGGPYSGWDCAEYLYRLPDRRFIWALHKVHHIRPQEVEGPYAKLLTADEAVAWLVFNRIRPPPDLETLSDKYFLNSTAGTTASIAEPEKSSSQIKPIGPTIDPEHGGGEAVSVPASANNLSLFYSDKVVGDVKKMAELMASDTTIGPMEAARKISSGTSRSPKGLYQSFRRKFIKNDIRFEPAHPLLALTPER